MKYARGYSWLEYMPKPVFKVPTPAKPRFERNAAELLEITRELFYWLTAHVEYCREARCNECKLYARIKDELISVYYGD